MVALLKIAHKLPQAQGRLVKRLAAANAPQRLLIELRKRAAKRFAGTDDGRKSIAHISQSHGLALRAFFVGINDLILDLFLDLVALETDIANGVEHFDARDLPIKLHGLVVNCGVNPPHRRRRGKGIAEPLHFAIRRRPAREISPAFQGNFYRSSRPSRSAHSSNLQFVHLLAPPNLAGRFSSFIYFYSRLKNWRHICGKIQAKVCQVPFQKMMPFSSSSGHCSPISSVYSCAYCGRKMQYPLGRGGCPRLAGRKSGSAKRSQLSRS